jgi:uncharacterized protein
MTPTGPATTGMTVLDLAQAGRFEEIHDLFAPPLRAMVPAEALQAAWASEIAQRGPVTAVGEPGSEPAGPGGVLVKVPVSFEHGEVTVVISFADAGWLAGIQLAPASAAEPAGPWQPPDYADLAAFDEQDVTVGSGPLAVPGTLSLPRQGGPWPAVVLLSGSGPNDRDETIGRNKPLKDLAGWKAGLAGRPDVTIRVYDADNHLFVPGSGPSSPAEYEPAQHVDPAVIADIAAWLATALPGPAAP